MILEHANGRWSLGNGAKLSYVSFNGHRKAELAGGHVSSL